MPHRGSELLMAEGAQIASWPQATPCTDSWPCSARHMDRVTPRGTAGTSQEARCGSWLDAGFGKRHHVPHQACQQRFSRASTRGSPVSVALSGRAAASSSSPAASLRRTLLRVEELGAAERGRLREVAAETHRKALPSPLRAEAAGTAARPGCLEEFAMQSREGKVSHRREEHAQGPAAGHQGPRLDGRQEGRAGPHGPEPRPPSHRCQAAWGRWASVWRATCALLASHQSHGTEPQGIQEQGRRDLGRDMSALRGEDPLTWKGAGGSFLDFSLLILRYEPGFPLLATFVPPKAMHPTPQRSLQ